MQARSVHRHEVLRFAGLLVMVTVPAIACANPTGPEVVQGTATFNTTGSTLTVTPSPNAIIQWRSFNVAPGETVRFVQPSGSSVINRIPGSSPSVAGQIESNGTVLFLNGSTLSGGDSSRDLAGIVDSSGRLQAIPASRRAAPRDDGPRRAVTLSGNRVFVIGADNVRRGSGRILLDPGRGAELGDVGIPYVRVYVESPAAKAVDLDSLVSRRPALGMFNALFAGRESARSEAGVTEFAAAPAAVEERPVIAYRAPVEDRAHVTVPGSHAPVEERPVLAFRAPAEERIPVWFYAPVEDRSLFAMPLVPAGVEERRVIAFNAPVEDRHVVAFNAPIEDRRVVAFNAPIEDRRVLAFNAPVEDRRIFFIPAVLAPVESRAVLAFNAPDEDRAVRILMIPPAPVEDRQVLALKEAPESAGTPAPAAVEERKIVAAAPTRPVAGAGDLVVLARPVPAKQVANTEQGAGEAAIRVAVAPSVVLPLAMVSAGSGEPVVRLPAVQRRLPRIMVDHRGAIFHL